jgi:hypothetical protein
MTLEALIAAYCAAWDEPDRVRRERILKDVWAEDGTYTDPSVHAVGRTALADHIGKVTARYPGSHIVVTSVVDTHHGLLRFAWKTILSDGTSLLEGTDFGELSGDGKLQRIVGFFGPLACK